MGKKKKRKKLAEKVDTYIAEHNLDPQELLTAGLGVLSQSIKKGKSKRFDKAIKRGRRVASYNLAAVADMLDPDAGLPTPVVSYRSTGGGWYDIEIGDMVVDQIQGEEDAAERAGELLAAFAALDPDDQLDDRTGVVEVGGGWYGVYVHGVPVDKVQGKELAEERYEEIEKLDESGRAA